MQITTALLGEHGLLYAQCDHLAQLLPTFSTLQHLHCHVDLLSAALRSHAHLEDRLLFTALDPYLEEKRALAIMRVEHEGIDYALAALPQIHDLAKARAGLDFVIAIVRRHCDREEQFIYPLVEETLPSTQLDHLGEQWARQRGVYVRSKT